jgi:hypothetical protein
MPGVLRVTAPMKATLMPSTAVTHVDASRLRSAASTTLAAMNGKRAPS